MAVECWHYWHHPDNKNSFKRSHLTIKLKKFQVVSKWVALKLFSNPFCISEFGEKKYHQWGQPVSSYLRKQAPKICLYTYRNVQEQQNTIQWSNDYAQKVERTMMK